MWRLMRNQRLQPEELMKLQSRKLRTMVKHSYDNVPYYHSLFREAKLRPDDVKTTEDLDKIPISKKQDIVVLPLEETVAKNIDLSNCLTRRTSGSTGTPMAVYWEKRARLLNYLQHYRWHLGCGDKITNRGVVVGNRVLLPTHPLQKIGVFKTKDISPFADPETQIKQIKEFDPHTMLAPPSCARILAKEITERDLQGINIHLIFTGAELLDENTRKLISEAFDAEVFDQHGTTEVGGVCGECIKRTGYHIWSDSVLVEIIQDCETVSKGEEGEITVTNLTNYAMPFIRYNLEDRGVLFGKECSCGSCFPLMKITGGRSSDIIHLPGGGAMSGVVVYQRLIEIQGIKQFQLSQEKVDRFTVKIVKGSKFTNATYEKIKGILKQKLGNVEIDVSTVDNIPREKSGKFKPFKPMKDS